MLFFSGWHQPRDGPSGCADFPYCMISINRLINRKSSFPVQRWILDSGAFTRISSGRGHLSVKRYAKEIQRWSDNGKLLAAVSQDFMCEPFILQKTGLSVAVHQRLTIHRYDLLNIELKNLDCNTYLMPVLQGFTPQEYVNHLQQYGERLHRGAWVGVGSVCKRNGNPSQIEAILMAIHLNRPDLNLHGFGLKKTALQSSIVWDILYSADSLAASYAARKSGRSGQNCPKTALKYTQEIRQPPQISIFACKSPASRTNMQKYH